MPPFPQLTRAQILSLTHTHAHTHTQTHPPSEKVQPSFEKVGCTTKPLHYENSALRGHFGKSTALTRCGLSRSCARAGRRTVCSFQPPPRSGTPQHEAGPAGRLPALRSEPLGACAAGAVAGLRHSHIGCVAGRAMGLQLRRTAARRRTHTAWPDHRGAVRLREVGQYEKCLYVRHDRCPTGRG